jgi:uncharacterized iron-regulated membrane protein
MSRIGNVLGAAAFVGLLVAGCAGEPRPAEDLARAKTLVQQAEAANVQRYAAADLNEARDKLDQAQKADTEEKNDIARRRANEAAAQAELASARARSREAEHAAEEMKKSLDVLRQEATRGVPVTEPNQ